MEKTLTQSQVKRKIKKIKRENKLYFRNSKGAIMRLDKVSEDIYGQIIVDFVNGAAQKYKMLNKHASGPDQVTPIAIQLDNKYAEQFESLSRVAGKWSNEEPIIIYGNSSSIKLAKISIKK